MPRIKAAVSAALLAAATTRLEQEVNKYNVLFILVDDLKPTLGAYGDFVAETPNIDKLLSKGLRLDNAHSQKSECAPSRMSMLSGHRNDFLRMWAFKEQFRQLHPSMQTLPGFLRKEGYRTEAVGKVFDNRYFNKEAFSLDGDECENKNGFECSFDFVEVPNVIYDGTKQCKGKNALRWPTEDPSIDQSKNNKGEALVWEFQNKLEDRHVDYCIAEIARERLKLLSEQSEPFFLAVGFAKPHMAWVAPTEDFDIFRQVPDHMMEPPPDLHTGSDISADDDDTADDFWGDNNAMSRVDSNSELYSYNGYDKVSFADRSRAYYACTTFVDAQIGRLLEVLDLTPDSVRNNTIILLWGDHGFHLGDHNLWGKKTVYEQATRVPLGVVPPKNFLTKNPDIQAQINKGLFSTSPVDSVDIFPTVLDMMGFEKRGSPSLAGTSMVPLMRDPKSFTRVASVSQYESYIDDNIMGYSIRTKYFCLIVYLDVNQGSRGKVISTIRPRSVQLYRYLQPGNFEAVDLYNQKEFKPVVDEMLKILRNPEPGSGGIPDDDWTHLYNRDGLTIEPFDHDMYDFKK